MNDRLILKITGFVLLVWLIMFSTIHAQFGSIGSIDARTSGMAGTSNAVSEGIYSIGINPANLTIKKNNFIDFTTLLPFPNAAIFSGTNFISLDDINYFFRGVNGNARVLSESDKNRFIDLMKNGGLVFNSSGLNLFSFGINLDNKIGSFAFSIHDAAGLNVTIPQAVSELIFFGNRQGHTFNLDDSDLKVWWIRNYALTYSRLLPDFKTLNFDNLSAGVTIKLVHGFSFIGTERSKYYFNTGSSNEISGSADMLAHSAFSDAFGVRYDFDSLRENKSISLFPPPAGTGLGFDFGAAALKNNWQFSISLTDLGFIRWYKNAAQFSSFGDIYVDDILNKEQIDTLKNRVLGKGERIESFSSGLASALRIGVSYLFNETLLPGKFLLAFDYDQGFNNLPGNSKYPVFSIGGEWKPMDWIPYIRTGFSYNYEQGFNWALGLGVDVSLVELHLSTSTMQSFIAPKHTKQISVFVGSRWKVN